MLPKIAHYAAFQSYGELPYPTLKAGKQTLDSNTIYQATVRPVDDLKLYENHNRLLTIYDTKVNKTVEPENFRNTTRVNKHEIEGTGKTILSRQLHGFKSVDGRNTINETEKIQTQRQERFDETNKGLQLYNSNVNSLKKIKSVQGLETTTNMKNTLQANEERNPRTRDILDEQTLKSQYLNTGAEHWKTIYKDSINYPSSVNQTKRPEWSYDRTPYTVEGGAGKSEYGTQFGERGYNPLKDIPNALKSQAPFPKSEDSLKAGTTQSGYHVPGYTGHIPKNLAPQDIMLQSTGSNSRTTILKQNIIENYHTRLPGYAGHRPCNAINERGHLRELCFSTKGETFNQQGKTKKIQL